MGWHLYCQFHSRTPFLSLSISLSLSLSLSLVVKMYVPTVFQPFLSSSSLLFSSSISRLNCRGHHPHFLLLPLVETTSVAIKTSTSKSVRASVWCKKSLSISRLNCLNLSWMQKQFIQKSVCASVWCKKACVCLSVSSMKCLILTSDNKSIALFF